MKKSKNMADDIFDSIVFVIVVTVMTVLIIILGNRTVPTDYTPRTYQCSEYRDTPLRDIPGKCIGSHGGYNEYNE